MNTYIYTYTYVSPLFFLIWPVARLFCLGGARVLRCGLHPPIHPSPTLTHFHTLSTYSNTGGAHPPIYHIDTHPHFHTLS